MAMNLHSRKGWFKASRFYALVFVLSTGFSVLTNDLPVKTIAQAQTAESRQADADKLLKQGRQEYSNRKFEAALQKYQQALVIYRAIKNRQDEIRALKELGFAYQYFGHF